MGISVTKTNINVLHTIVFFFNNFGPQTTKSLIHNYPSILFFFFFTLDFVTCIKLMSKLNIKGVLNNNTYLGL